MGSHSSLQKSPCSNHNFSLTDTVHTCMLSSACSVNVIGDHSRFSPQNSNPWQCHCEKSDVPHSNRWNLCGPVQTPFPPPPSPSTHLVSHKPHRCINRSSFKMSTPILFLLGAPSCSNSGQKNVPSTWCFGCFGPSLVNATGVTYILGVALYMKEQTFQLHECSILVHRT